MLQYFFIVLARLFNTFIKNGTFPYIFKTAKVLPVPDKLSSKNKLILYQMCIGPIMTYACPGWFKKTVASHKKTTSHPKQTSKE